MSKQSEDGTLKSRMRKESRKGNILTENRRAREGKEETVTVGWSYKPFALTIENTKFHLTLTEAQ